MAEPPGETGGDGVSEGGQVAWRLGASEKAGWSLVDSFKQYFFHDFRGISLK